MTRSHSGRNLIIVFVGLLLLVGGAAAYKFWPQPQQPGPARASKEKEPDPALKVKEGAVVEVPFILWGGDVATFMANGDFETQPGSVFASHGLKLKLVPGDDFPKQVENYLKGSCPFLRGTLSMLGQFSKELTDDPRTTPVVFLQLTWSAGDHLVARGTLKTLNDLKGKKIALQKGGPHVGMLNDILRTARLEWKDVQIVWTEDVTGDKGPAEKFRKDNTIDACFAISPDMTDLTGGLEEKGTGQKTTVQGAHVLVSTTHMSRSIADVYACRKDFFNSNRELVEKFAAGYLKACEELVAVKKGALDLKEAAAIKRWDSIIQLTQAIYGKDPINAPAVKEKDAVEGLISDASFVGLPGNVFFFTDAGNLSGFNFKQRVALVLPADPAKEPLKESPQGFLKAEFDYDALRKRGGLTGKAAHEPRFVLEAEYKFEPEKTIYTFTISFDPDKNTFPEPQYAQEFQRALEQASLFGNAVVAVRGHADPSLLTHMFLETAKGKGLLKEEGPDKHLVADGARLDLNDTRRILALIEKNNLVLPKDSRLSGGRQQGLGEVVQGLKRLSGERARAVLKAVVGYAGQRKLVLEESQMRSVGVGVEEPIVAYGKKQSEMARNRRVEFRIIKVPIDKVRTYEFEL